MKKRGLYTAVFLLITAVLGLTGCADNKDETLTTTFGGEDDDRAYAVQQTSDGGYIVAGEKGYVVDKEWDDDTQKWEENVSHTDIWIIKLDSDRDKSWEKTFGELNLDESAYAIQQTGDGGFIVAGGCENATTSGTDGCVLKLDSAGNIEWQKRFDLSGYGPANAVLPTSDGGYIVVGTILDFAWSNSDAWVAKLDGAGNTLWGNLYSGPGADFDGAYSVREITGGYIVAGYSFGLIPLDFNAWVFTVDGNGVQVYSQTYDFPDSNGVTGNEGAYDIQQTSDGGYIVAASRYPVSCTSGSDCREESTTIIFKLDPSLVKTWAVWLPGKQFSRAYSIIESADGGFVAAGYTGTYVEKDILDKKVQVVSRDLWVVKLGADQSKVWEKTFGGMNDEQAWEIAPTSDGGFIVAGETGSYGEGGFDAWVLKLDSNGKCEGDSCP
jgi:hypothetical protein